ncbi:porin family protein [Halanaerobaculum tunisiense]
MKKIVGLLTFVLVLGLAVPGFAAEDNVEITGTVDTIFEVGGYGDNTDATKELWADDDVLDEDYEEDPDLFPAEKAFYQEIGLNVAGTVNENIAFDLAIDTLTNNFTKVEGPGVLGNPVTEDGKSDASDLVMDTALLTIDTAASTIKLGDMNDYGAETYFIDEEDVEGAEVSTAIAGNDVTGFVVSDNDDFKEKINGEDEEVEGIDFYGVKATKNLEIADLTGKIYQARVAGYDVTNLAVAGEKEMNALTLNGEVVANSADEEVASFAAKNDTAATALNQDAEGDALINLGADYKVSDVLSVNGTVEKVGDEFVAVAHDLEEDADYELYEVGAEYKLDTATNVSGSYTMVQPGNSLEDKYEDDETKKTIEVALDNTRGAFTNTASVEMTTNDAYAEDTDVTVISLGTDYAMTDATTVTADLVNQSADDKYDNDFTYLTAGLDTQVSENVTWNTEAKYVSGDAYNDDGEVTIDDEGEGSALTTKLSVNF